MCTPALDEHAALSVIKVNCEPKRQWYLVYTKARSERIARDQLERQGYEVYLPMMRQLRRRGGRRVTQVAPMFPRYLFIHLSTDIDNWSPIRSTRGVASLVQFGHRPGQVPAGLIPLLRSHEDASGIQVIPGDEYRAGTRVRLVEGGMKGFEGVYLARSSRDRVVVLLEIMGRHTRATVEVSVVEPA